MWCVSYGVNSRIFITFVVHVYVSRSRRFHRKPLGLGLVGKRRIIPSGHCSENRANESVVSMWGLGRSYLYVRKFTLEDRQPTTEIPRIRFTI